VKMIDRYYFIGIGGIGMSSLAKYLFYKGNLVSGYDKTKGFITEELNEEGIQVVYKDSIEAIPEKFKLKGTKIIYTPAIPNDNIQLNYFIHNDFEVKKRSYLLGNITKDSKVFAIAGTHGKTTTSAILCHMCNSIKLNFTAFLGGIANGFNSNLISNGNEFSIVEADEYDRSFLELYPTFSCITSMDADHLDIYGNKSNLVEAFKEFSKRTKKHLLVAKGLPIKGITFSLDQKADYYATNILQNNLGYKFDFHTPSSIYRDIEFNTIGRYNLLNAIAASAMIDLAEIPLNDALNSLKYFKGLKRRIEIFEIGGKVIIDDYAHHPTEINSVFNAINERYLNKKKAVIFQPHLFSRTRDFINEFADSLSQFDEIYLTEIYPAREKPISGINSQKLINKIKNSSKKIVFKGDIENTIKESKANLFAILGAGDIGEEIEKLKIKYKVYEN
tara:strand:- start:1659 stop:2996 length:1338 start_codon:yes stop_codon:yes gene_type:complete